MSTTTSSAEWKGNLNDGQGVMKLGSGAFEGAYNFASRFQSGPGTNPEEWIGAAHAGCYSMFLSAVLSGAGFTPDRVTTTATVHLGEGPAITDIELATEVKVNGLSEADFQKHAEFAKLNCPVSRALAGPKITLRAVLLK